MGQSETEVSEEAVAGNEDAAAMTVARIASGERSIGGSDWELVSNSLGFVLSVESQRRVIRNMGGLRKHTELHQFAVDLNLPHQIIQAALKRLDIFYGRSVEMCR